MLDKTGEAHARRSGCVVKGDLLEAIARGDFERIGKGRGRIRRTRRFENRRLRTIWRPVAAPHIRVGEVGGNDVHLRPLCGHAARGDIEGGDRFAHRRVSSATVRNSRSMARACSVRALYQTLFLAMPPIAYSIAPVGPPASTSRIAAANRRPRSVVCAAGSTSRGTNPGVPALAASPASTAA